MSFIKKYPPQTVSDLVFATAKGQTMIDDYATGQKVEHLLLYGLPGAGKSIAAQVIVHSRMPALVGSTYISPLHGETQPKQLLDTIEGQRGWQSTQGYSQRYIVIDELDMLATTTRNTLRNHIDNKWDRTTLICTTNRISSFDDAFLDRFQKLEMPLPTLAQWTPRILTILKAEGYAAPATATFNQTASTPMSGRDVIRVILNIIMAAKNSVPPTPQSSSVSAAAIAPATTPPTP